MWPWDHFAIGYVALSLLGRADIRFTPTAGAVAFVFVGSQLPDLVDKPLGWVFHVLPSVGLGHSLLLALPVSAAVIWWRGRHGRRGEGVAFGLGYLLHLPADALYPALLGAETKPWLFLWPLTAGETAPPTALPDQLYTLVSDFVAVAASPAGVPILALEGGLLCLTVWLWLADGQPGRPRG